MKLVNEKVTIELYAFREESMWKRVNDECGSVDVRIVLFHPLVNEGNPIIIFISEEI